MRDTLPLSPSHPLVEGPEDEKQNILYYNSLTAEEQIKKVYFNSFVFRYIKNPSRTLQLLAVSRDGYAIDCIENPSEAVQLAAVKRNGYAIQYIKNPSEAVQLAAVQHTVTALRFIKNPSEAIQLFVVRDSISWLQFIKAQMTPEWETFLRLSAGPKAEWDTGDNTSLMYQIMA